jgi:hypothetical protein
MRPNAGLRGLKAREEVDTKPSQGLAPVRECHEIRAAALQHVGQGVRYEAEALLQLFDQALRVLEQIRELGEL